MDFSDFFLSVSEFFRIFSEFLCCYSEWSGVSRILSQFLFVFFRISRYLPSFYRKFTEFVYSFSEWSEISQSFYRVLRTFFVISEVSEVITPMCMPHSCIGTHCARVLWNTAAFCHILNREYLEDMELSTKILKATHL